MSKLVRDLREQARSYDDWAQEKCLETAAANTIETLLEFVVLLSDYIPNSAIGNMTVHDAIP